MCDNILSAKVAVDDIHNSMAFANDHLSRLSHRLETECARLQTRSPSHTNFFNMLLRIRTLEASLRQLSDSIANWHCQKSDAINLVGKMRHGHRFAELASPQATSALDLSTRTLITEGLSQLRNQLLTVSDAFGTVNNEEGGHNNVSHLLREKFCSNEQLGMRAPVSASKIPYEQAKSHKKAFHDTEDLMIGNQATSLKPTTPVKVMSTKAKNQGIQANSVSPKSKSIEPISKAAFNRLPRNLKIRAGKLSEINKFYETVFHALVDNQVEGLSDNKLMQVTGENTMEKFEVLRGLAVLRCRKQRWSLATKN